MIIKEIGKYSIQTISRFVSIYRDEAGTPHVECAPVPIKEGVHICKKCIDGTSNYAILEVKYDAKEGGCDVNSIGDRILDIDTSEWSNVKELIIEAEEMIIKANKEGDE